MAKHAAIPPKPSETPTAPFLRFFLLLLRACVLIRDVSPNFFRSFQAMTGI